MKRFFFCLAALLMLSVSLSARSFKMTQEGGKIIGISENGDMMMKENGSAVFMSSDPNSVSTVVRYTPDSKIKSISGNGAVEFVYTDGKAQVLSCTPSKAPYKSSAGGIIGWADELLHNICDKYGKDINVTLEKIDKWEQVTNIANANSVGELAQIAVEDKFEVLGTMKDLAEWALKKNNAGWTLAKTAASLIANYNEWTDKWSDFCYKAMLNLDKNRRLQKKFFERQDEDELIKQNMQQMHDRFMKQKAAAEKKKEKQKQDDLKRQQLLQQMVKNNGNCPSHNGSDTYFHISRRSIMSPLPAAELAQYEKEAGKEAAEITKTWIESLPEVRANVSAEGISELSKLTYDEWFDFARGWMEVMALGFAKSADQVREHMMVLGCELDNNAHLSDKELGEHMLLYFANWNISRVFEKYKVGKYVKLFNKKF